MTIKQAIEQLSKLPPDGELRVPSMAHGGLVPLQAFRDLSLIETNWIGVVYCDNDERPRYGLPPITPVDTIELKQATSWRDYIAIQAWESMKGTDKNLIQALMEDAFTYGAPVDVIFANEGRSKWEVMNVLPVYHPFFQFYNQLKQDESNTKTSE